MLELAATCLLALLLLTSCRPLAPTLEGHFSAGDASLFLQRYGDRNRQPIMLLEHGIGDRASSATWKGRAASVEFCLRVPL